MRQFSEITKSQAAGIRYVLCDIDDTLTNGGKLTAAAYSALWALADAGFRVIPVTGRPAGWCDLIVREWPVEAVIGENGAFCMYFRDGKLQTMLHPNVIPNASERLEAVRNAVLAAVPQSRVARDQFSRIYDLAIDFCEDPPFLPLSDAEKIRAVCERMGAEAKISSIHVNAWFGKYDKLDMALRVLSEVFGEKSPESSVIFFGDSPNDEPMFAHFPLSCAVANIAPFVSTMKNLPAFVTCGEGGFGFEEAAKHIISLKF